MDVVLTLVSKNGVHRDLEAESDIVSHSALLHGRGSTYLPEARELRLAVADVFERQTVVQQAIVKRVRPRL